jgi:hypothetical protein
MKTLRLNRAESTAYANGERRLWRAMRKQPEATGHNGGKLRGIVWNDAFDQWDAQYFGDNPRRVGKCPYGKPGDLIKMSGGEVVEGVFMLTAVTVEQRDRRWGWVVEVGA